MESAGEDHLAAHTTALYAILVVLLVLGAGLMSGLTLGLLSLDVMDLEVRCGGGGWCVCVRVRVCAYAHATVGVGYLIFS